MTENDIEIMRHELVKAIKKVALSIINDENICRLLKGQVVSILGNGKYGVRINGKSYTATSRFECNINDVVNILQPKYGKMIDLIII